MYTHLGMSSIVAATTASVVGDQKNVVQEQKKYKEQLDSQIQIR